MKTFLDLAAKDGIYYCHVDSYKYQYKIPISISFSQIETGIGNGGSSSFVIQGDDMKKSIVRKNGYHHISVIIFANKSDCIRYCKAQLIKELHSRIDKAKSAIESVKQLRKENWEELNDKWSEDQIRKLERELR